MLKGENKMITGKEKNVKNKAVEKTDEYFFPEHSVTITASSQEEAYQKLQAIINKKQ